MSVFFDSRQPDDSDPGGSREPLGVDGNGLLTERVMIGGQEVIVHYDDVPPSDITLVDGIRCTTPVRTIIDCAPDLTTAELLDMLDQALRRNLVTLEEAWERIRQPDMQGRRGADLLRRLLPPIEG
jgi:hypothetical protein